MRNIRRKNNSRPTFAAAAFALLALFVLGPASVKAQWTTPDASGNIGNTNTGSVGVGTTAPAFKFEVRGSSSRNTMAVTGDGDAAGFAGIKIQALTTTGIASNRTSQFNFHMRKDSWYGGDGSGPSFIIETVSKTGGYAAPFLITPTNDIILNGGQGASGLSYGRVGVGTTSPANGLHVNSSSGIQAVRVSGLGGGMMNFIDTGGAANQKLYQWRSEAGVFRMALVNDAENAFVQQNLLVANSAGNVGFGTASPGEKLHVNGGVVVTGAASETVGINGLFLGFSGTTASIDAVQQGTDYRNLSLGAKTFSVKTWNGSASVQGLYQSSSGNVGVGTINPQKALDVTGDVRASGAITGGTISATYQDVAEWVPSEQKLEAGTVVVLDTTQSNHVLASTSSYDTGVAGVISARPGIALGEGGEGKVLVATTGRVRVKVDATKGAIKVGDLLVTSDVEGVAMKSEPIVVGGRKMHAPGTIIGKALEPLENGVGEILVLLSLQ